MSKKADAGPHGAARAHTPHARETSAYRQIAARPNQPVGEAPRARIGGSRSAYRRIREAGSADHGQLTRVIAEVPGRLQESASQRKLAEARTNDALVLRSLAPVGDAGLRGGELAAMTALPERTVRAVLARLTARGLVARDGQRGAVRATVAGRTEAGAGTPGVALSSALEGAIDHFPAEAQRAFVRLLLSGIVARHHLAADYPSGWGGFIVVGPTKTAKTSLATFACRLFGIDRQRAVRVLRDETPGSIFVRRQQAKGGEWTAAPSRLLDLPFLCLDEYDKAPEEVRREAARLLQGETRVEVEGVSFPVSPVPMVVLNAQPGELPQRLHEAYVRRSPVLDTGALGGLLADVDEAMRKLFGPGAIPRLDLGRPRPPLRLQEADRGKLRSALRSGLTEEGWRLVDVEAISRLALGRVPLMGDGASAAQACLATALDYLIVTSTMPGHVRQGAIGELRGQLGGDVPMVADVEAHLAQQTTLGRLDRDQRAAKAADDAAFAADRAELGARLTQLVERLGRRRDPEAAAVKAALRKLARTAQGCRARDALDAVDAAALPWGERAKAVLDRWAVEAQRAAQAKADAAAERRREVARRSEQGRLDREAKRRRVEEEREAKTRARHEWTAARRALHRLTPYSSLQGALDELAEAGWLERVALPSGPGWVGRLIGRGIEYRIALDGIKRWPAGHLVGGREVQAFWAAARDHADAQVRASAGRSAKQPVWRQKPAYNLDAELRKLK